MKSVRLALILLLVCVMPAAALAQNGTRTQESGKVEEVVVTATRIETPVKEIASSITVIGAAKIKSGRKSLVLDLLRRVPSLNVVRSGGAGKSASVFIRGANSEHTLVLLDGIEMNDPISVGRAFDFANLTTDNIERIEIIRGPQSTLYGSDAMGGVINIITKRGSGKPSYYFSGEVGSFKTSKQSAGVSAGYGSVNYSIGLSRFSTDGISSAGAEYGNIEKDGYRNKTVSARLGFEPSGYLDIDFILRYSDSESGIDNSAGTGGDDSNNIYKKRTLFLRASTGLVLLDGLWEQKLGLSYSDHDRRNNNGTDPAHPLSLVRSSFDSSLSKFDWQHDFYLNSSDTVTAGVEYEEERANYDYYSKSGWGPFSVNFKRRSARTAGYYLQGQAKIKGRLFTTAGIRVDKHSRFGSVTTYRTTAAYLIKPVGSKLKATYGTGFKTPSLFQLYSQYGDTNLTPENSRGWDVGIERRFAGAKAVMGVTYFRNDFKNLIEYDSGTSKYTNVAASKAEGVELSAETRLFARLDLGMGYTYTDTKDRGTGEALRRRAKHKATADLNYPFLNEKGNVNIGIVYIGSRLDKDYTAWPAKLVKLHGYTLVDVAASYNITQNIELNGRIENLFDEKYEEVKGYGTPGVAAYGGVKLTF